MSSRNGDHFPSLIVFNLFYQFCDAIVPFEDSSGAGVGIRILRWKESIKARDMKYK